MKTWLKILTAVFFVLILFLAEGRFREADGIRAFRLSDRKKVSFQEMMKDVERTRVVLVGEIHNNIEDHILQLDIIKALKASGVPVAVGFEMFTAESQGDLDQWVSGVIPVSEFIQIYYRNWNLPWPLYRDILLYLRENKIPALGLNLPADISGKVARNGFSSLTEQELRKLPPGISCNVDKEYMAFIRRAYSEHTGGGAAFVNFCEAQILWDKTMAWHITRFSGDNASRRIVVLTGAGHAWKKGIPEQLESLDEKISYRVILPETPGYIEPSTMTSKEADYILLRR